MEKAMVLVTGAGRSGTSTAAGTLSHLGVHVPGPFLKANTSNPKGFYESRWSVDFHNKLLKRANLTLADSRPDALELVRDAVRDQDRARIRTWLESSTEGHPVTGLKDPRTVWTLSLWWELADELGIALRTLTMLRHPAEVVGSRATHYSRGVDVLGERGFAIKNLAGWANAMLLTEQQTRGHRRAFVRYDDLLADWRTAMGSAAEAMGVGVDLGPEAAAAVDEFIDPGLSRHHLTWADVDVPAGLKDVAEEIWQACDRLADRSGQDAEAEAALDAARERYAQMYSDAQYLTNDATAARIKQARADAEREAALKPPAQGALVAEEAGPRQKARQALGRLKRKLR